MPIVIAEYLGQRTDTGLPIQPQEILPPEDRGQSPLCPFCDMPCFKMSKKTNPKPPVCSVWSGRSSNQYYIVCEHRLLSSSVNRLTEYQRAMLLKAAQALFSSHITAAQLGFKAEVRVRTVERSTAVHRADFVLAVVDPSLTVFRHRRLLVEVQGGGETGSTGSLSTHIKNWAANPNRTNQELKSRIKKVTRVETNAWRRLQEQLFAKATTANKSGIGFAALMGEVVFNYIVKMLPTLPSLNVGSNGQWNVAFVVFKEKALDPNENPVGSVELVVDPARTVFTDLHTLFAAMAQRGRRSPEAFAGEYQVLSGGTISLAEDGSTVRPLI